MRIFIRLNQNNLAVGQLQSERIPGDTGSLPADILEVTDRTDGPWLGKTYNAGTDSFSVPALAKADYKAIMDSKYEDWQRARNTLTGAQSHGEAAGVITALTNRENAAWTTYKQAIQDWIQAP